MRVPAWGGGGLRFGPPGGGGLLTNMRSVGPIEFLCLWTGRDLASEPLDGDAFETALTWLLRLFEASPRAAILYQARLAADIESPVEGLYDRESRALIRTLVEAWEAGGPPEEIARRTRAGLGRDPFARLPR